MKNQMKRLSDVFPDWIIGSGIFSELHKFDVPWKNKFNSEPLDLAYFGNNSGDKIISPLVEKLLVNDVLPEENLNKLASAIYTLNIDNWSRLWLALQEEYDPLQNYNGNETRTVTNKLTGTDTVASSGVDKVDSTVSNSNVKTGSLNVEDSGVDSIASSGSDTISDTTNSSVTKSGSVEVKDSGSDSIASSGSDSTNNSSTGSVTKSGSQKVTDSGSDSLSHSGSGSETISGSKTESSDGSSSVYGFNSGSAVPSDTTNQDVTTNYNNVKTDRTDTLNDTTSYGKVETTSFDSLKDTQEGTEQSSVTYGKTDTSTYGKVETTSYKSLTDSQSGQNSSETTYGKTDTTSYGKKEKTSFDSVTDTQSGQNSTETTYGKTDTNTKNLTTTVTDEFHREGNLGITSSQQMLNQELELREKYYFFGIVFKDLDKSLSLLIY